MNTKMIVLGAISILVAGGCCARTGTHGLESDAIPDMNTALTVGHAYLVSVYGKDAIAKQQPLVATLSDETWTVNGNLPLTEDTMYGGVATITLNKRTGAVEALTHGK